MLHCGATQHPRHHLHLLQVSVGDDTPTKVRPERVDNGKIAAVLIAHSARIESIRVSRREKW
jgi:hypothetical protein